MLCASRKMPSSVSLLPIPLAFHCSMLNVLSNMVGVWVGVGYIIYPPYATVTGDLDRGREECVCE